jgi:nucleotide-binding universal stress UspA family protein
MGLHSPQCRYASYAAKNEIDLIVMCTRRHGGFKRWALGSTADGVVQKAPVPVLLVRIGGQNEVEAG